ncbi:hypothetical protein GOP47_0026042 [Adiantum capillus-veneris]|uniref:Pentatricopeptide repeat-containing protein n=1 Tax=Adiantum capillus-veneris TaxID=13818 RepID=A0A9D4Z2L6_ADICA|nr:hypothetical protein GOP47_0026042 [Adiantum capillus-veneris]
MQLQSFGLSTSMTGGEDLESRRDLSWQEFFKDPSKWWDNRSSKRSPRHPDFKHKVTKEPLWMHGRNNPSWVKDELFRRGFAVEQSIETSSSPDAFPASLIWDCSRNKDLSRGTRLHNELQERGLLEQEYSDALITMYAKCGEPEKAQALLDKHNIRNTIAWNALIAGYARDGQGQKALDCFERMQEEGIPPGAASYVCVLKACGVMGAIDKGKQVHDEILRQGLLQHNIVLGGALVDMYAKCGDLLQAHTVLKNLPSRNVILWNALITGYVQKGQGRKALECCKEMQSEGISPNTVTYICILKSCAIIKAIDKGKQIHDAILRQGLLEHSVVLGGALVDMYAKCGALPQAQAVLDELPSRNVICWSALIAGYAERDQGQKALECFQDMRRDGIAPDVVTYLSVVKACAVLGDIDKGKQIHNEILRQGLLKHNILLGNALVDMYAKCGALSQARSVLEKLPSRDVVSWSSLIAGYAQEGQGQQALECFKQMQLEDIPPNVVTYVCILKACAVIKALDKGKQIHNEISRQGLLEESMELGNSLVDMYAKCGALPQAQNVLENLSSRDVVSWSALIAGFAQKGLGQQAVKCFEQMQQEGIAPNAVTYLCMLKACAAVGAIDKGKQIHEDVLKQGLLEQNIELGNALVDMYAKCGALQQAQSILEELPSRDVVSWNALITGYAQEGQSEQAWKCFEKMQSEGINPNMVTFFCLLNMCGHLGLLEKGQELFDSMGGKYGLQPDIECFTCMVDLLGRAGHLVKAVEVIQKMPFPASSKLWLCLLSACQKWVDVDVGTWAFEQALEVEKCEATYILMANIYAAAGMPGKVRDIEAMIKKNKTWKQAGWVLNNQEGHRIPGPTKVVKTTKKVINHERVEQIGQKSP